MKTKENLDIYTQLMLLKEATNRFGALHEAQILQLKMYPILLFGVLKSETHIDVERKMVFFKLVETKSFKLSKKNKDIIKNIVNWTRGLLWDDCSVIFMKDEEVIYDTRS
jgi:hypothetical protein